MPSQHSINRCLATGWAGASASYAGAAARIAGAAIAIASTAALADIKRHASIPDAFWGSWAASADNCGAGDKSLIVVAAKAITNAESKCTVDWVSETPGATGPTYSVRVRCTDSSAKAPSVRNLIIRPVDANQISAGADFDSLKTYTKCATKG